MCYTIICTTKRTGPSISTSFIAVTFCWYTQVFDESIFVYFTPQSFSVEFEFKKKTKKKMKYDFETIPSLRLRVFIIFGDLSNCDFYIRRYFTIKTSHFVYVYPLRLSSSERPGRNSSVISTYSVYLKRKISFETTRGIIIMCL